MTRFNFTPGGTCTVLDRFFCRSADLGAGAVWAKLCTPPASMSFVFELFFEFI